MNTLFYADGRPFEYDEVVEERQYNPSELRTEYTARYILKGIQVAYKATYVKGMQ